MIIHNIVDFFFGTKKSNQVSLPMDLFISLIYFQPNIFCL